MTHRSRFLQGKTCQSLTGSCSVRLVSSNMYQPTEKDCVGSKAKYIKLVSSDGKAFFLKRLDAVYVSPFMKDLLACTSEYTKHCKKEELIQLTFKDVPSHMLKEECDYINYHARMKKMN
ncbi:Hypothetical predicted protein [Cloeon dipterum]|uniref:Elongin-C n=1 Tax=Cloeon dipterum TaxID=197152 RepID=A0A8S1C7J5_9INSE|nr:Hypothetical predicted protein [Cloeon dipterum]